MFARLKRWLALEVVSDPRIHMRTCELYWEELAAGRFERHGDCTAAQNELAKCGPEVRDWARGLLNHPEYEARSFGAFLLGELGRKRQLGDGEDAVIEELGALTRRPIGEEAKEAEAVCSAVTAIGRIGNRRAVPFIRDVLNSTDPSIVGDTQWEAAGVLGRLVGEQFNRTGNPVAAAVAWLASHPVDNDE